MSKINIFFLIILIFIIPSIQNVDALQEVNKSIQINEIYKQGFDLENGTILRLNLTTDNYADFFFLSEQGLIDYEINKIAKPSHINWYKLNTNSFSENLTINSRGEYFLIVDTRLTPTTSNETFNISGFYDIKKPQIQTESVSAFRKFIGAVFTLLLVLCFPIIIILGRKKFAETIVIYIILLGVSILIGDIRIFNNIFNGNLNQDQMLYLLSTLIQSLAALLAIVVSINFVISQASAQIYTSAIIKSFIRSPSFIRFVGINIALIGLLVMYLSDLNIAYGYFKIPGTGIFLFRNIDMLIIFFIFAIAMIVPYMYGTLELMKPAYIIEQLGNEVTPNSLLKSAKLRRNLNIKLEDNKAKQKAFGLKLNRIINYFNKSKNNDKGAEFESDGIQPLRDIANKAIKNSNYEIYRISSNKLEELGKKFLQNSKIYDNDKAIIAEHFGYHLSKIAEIALIEKDVATITSIVNSLIEINNASDNDSIAFETVVYIGKIGQKCASGRLENNAYNVIDSLGELGETFASKEWIKSTDQTLNEIYAISEKLIQNELLIIRSKYIMNSFYIITKKAIEKQLDFQIMKALINSQKLANHIIKYRKDNSVIPGELDSFLSILEEVGMKITSEMVHSNKILPAIIENIRKMGEDTQNTGFLEELTRTLNKIKRK